jgi:hypothetical protein
MRRSITVAVGVLLFCAVVVHLKAATITVTNTNDSGPGSLRQALAVAHDGDRITFAVSGTITLTSGALVVAKSVTISGPGADQLSIVGIHFQSVFFIAEVKGATISGLTIRNGAEGIDNAGGGTLTVRNCVISGMSVDGIGNVASLTVVNSNVSDNDGFGISNITGEFGVVTATILSTTVSGNLAGGVLSAPNFFGGRAYITITDCTISGNFSAPGEGGIFGGVGTLLTVANSTISGNSAGTSGGGIYNVGSLHVANCTISGNSAPSAGGEGIYNDAVVEISNTILNAGALGENIFNNGGTVTSDGYNLSSDDGGGYLTGPGDQINTDPLLGPLQSNGGPTFTHGLLPGSPAIDAGDPNFSPPPFNDQRGCPFDRVSNGRIDIGSYETQPQAPRSPPCPQPRPTPRPRPTSPQ